MWGFRAVWAGDETKRCHETAPVPRAAFGGAGEKQGALHGRMEVSGSLTGVQMGAGVAGPPATVLILFIQHALCWPHTLLGPGSVKVLVPYRPWVDSGLAV